MFFCASLASIKWHIIFYLLPASFPLCLRETTKWTNRCSEWCWDKQHYFFYYSVLFICNKTYNANVWILIYNCSLHWSKETIWNRSTFVMHIAQVPFCTLRIDWCSLLSWLYHNVLWCTNPLLDSELCFVLPLLFGNASIIFS